MALRSKQSIEGRVVAITGGARGIGAATGKALAAKGAKISIGDLDVALADQTAAEFGGGAIALSLDVTDRASFERFLDETEEKLGPLDVLINNAGIMPVGALLDESDATARRIIDIDVHGVILGSKLAAARMVPRGTGHIVNLASQAGNGGVPNLATYCAAKHAVVGLSESLRGELLDAGIEVSCVMPAIVNTELTAGVQETRGVKKVEPEDVADAIVGTLERPRHDVHVPRSAGVIGKIVHPLPRRAREAIGRAMKVDQIMVEADQQARKAYEERAAASAPASDQAAGHQRERSSASQQ